MRILVHCADRGVALHGPSGASEHLRSVVAALQRAGHDVRVSVASIVDDRGSWGDPLGVPVYAGPGPRWPRGLRSFGAVVDAAAPLHRAVADGWRPDWIWERHALQSGVPGFAARQGARWLVELNAPVVRERRAVGARVGAYAVHREGVRLRRADRIVAVSTWLANWAVDRGAAARRVRVVPNGVAPQAPLDRRAARAQLPVPPGALAMAFVGSFKSAHGVDRLRTLVDAVGDDAWVVAIGDGPLALDAHPRMVEFGQVAPEAVAPLIAGCDVGLAPYRADAPPWFCPLKVLAYRAQGVPVVSGPVPSVPRLLGADGGEVVHSDRIEAWVAAIRRQAPRRPAPACRTWDDVVSEALR